MAKKKLEIVDTPRLYGRLFWEYKTEKDIVEQIDRFSKGFNDRKYLRNVCAMINFEYLQITLTQKQATYAKILLIRLR